MNPAFEGTKNESMKNVGRDFIGLPPEILLEIIKYLPAKEIANLNKVNKTLNMMVQDEEVWIEKGYQDYSLRLQKNCNISVKHLYQQILFKFADLCGIWQELLPNYCRLMQVSFENNALVFARIVPPKSLAKSFQREMLLNFTVDPGKENISMEKGFLYQLLRGEITILVDGKIRFSEKKQDDISKVVLFENPEIGIILEIQNDENLPESVNRKDLVKSLFHHEVQTHGNDTDQDQIKRARDTIRSGFSSQYRNVVLNCSSSFNSFLQTTSISPGIFKAKLDGSAVEYVHLNNTDEQMMGMKGKRLTGNHEYKFDVFEVQEELCMSSLKENMESCESLLSFLEAPIRESKSNIKFRLPYDLKMDETEFTLNLNFPERCWRCIYTLYGNKYVGLFVLFQNEEDLFIIVLPQLNLLKIFVREIFNVHG